MVMFGFSYCKRLFKEFHTQIWLMVMFGFSYFKRFFKEFYAQIWLSSELRVVINDVEYCTCVPGRFWEGSTVPVQPD